MSTITSRSTSEAACDALQLYQWSRRLHDGQRMRSSRNVKRTWSLIQSEASLRQARPVYFNKAENGSKGNGADCWSSVVSSAALCAGEMHCLQPQRLLLARRRRHDQQVRRVVAHDLHLSLRCEGAGSTARNATEYVECLECLSNLVALAPTTAERTILTPDCPPLLSVLAVNRR